MSDNLTVWLAFILGGIITFLQRASFILFSGDRSLPDPIQRALQYVAPAAFAAIVAPRVIGTGGFSELTSPTLACWPPSSGACSCGRSQSCR